MEIKVKKLTDVDILRKSAAYTSGKECKMSLKTAYKSEHSIIRTQWFQVEMIGIPTFVSVHLVRHKVGVEHFVKSNREDRGGDSNANRNTPVDHMMIVNAQALIHMAQSRLCAKAHPKTREVMDMIRSAVADVDPDLARFMVRRCVSRGGLCGEPQCCGYNKTDIFRKQFEQYRLMFI